MGVTRWQGGGTQVTCLPAAGWLHALFPESSGLYSTQLVCHLLLPLCTSFPRKWENFRMSKNLRRPSRWVSAAAVWRSSLMLGGNGETWRTLRAPDVRTFLPAHSLPGNSFLFLCVLAYKQRLLSEKVSLLFRQNGCFSATGNTLVPTAPIMRGKMTAKTKNRLTSTFIFDNKNINSISHLQ